MVRIAKRIIKTIQHASVYDSVLRERFTSTLTGYFADDRPEMWDSSERDAFDLAVEVENRMRDGILRILGATPERDERK